MPDRNTDLTIEQRITAAFLHYVRDVEQQDIAMAFSTNLGRVNEACLAIKLAAIDPKQARKALVRFEIVEEANKIVHERV